MSQAPYLQQSLRGWLHRGSQAGIARAPAPPSVPSQLRMSQVIASAGPANGAPAKQAAPKGQGKGKKGRGKDADDESKSGPYSNTVFLPTTDFSLRANSIVREPQIQQWWEEQRIYEQLAEENPGVSARNKQPLSADIPQRLYTQFGRTHGMPQSQLPQLTRQAAVGTRARTGAPTHSL